MNLDIFRRIINHRRDNTIIQFSPIRSGSTLVYNILKEVFPKRNILKKHNCENSDLKHPVVVTYRHPLDCLASSIQRYELTPTNEVLEQQISEFNNNGCWDVLKIKNNPNVLMLRYEEFVYDFEVIISGIEKFFYIEIPLEIKNLIIDRYQVEAIEKIVENKNTFAKYDKITHWHGKHISKYKGKPLYHRELFQDDQIAYLTNIYKKFLIEFDYI